MCLALCPINMSDEVKIKVETFFRRVSCGKQAEQRKQYSLGTGTKTHGVDLTEGLWGALTMRAWSSGGV